MSKTPEDIKKALERCGGLDCDCENCPYDDLTFYCNDRLMRDALAYIKQLEAGIDHAEKVARECARSITENLDKLQSRLAQVERERDAAVHDLGKAMSLDEVEDCSFCKNNKKPYCDPCKWEWRGVCKENTKENEHHG